jgi:DNA-binding LytR/AlgR family response regulator
MGTENIRFFIVDDLWGKREKIKNIIQEIDPEAEIEMFGHPVYLRRWL